MFKDYTTYAQDNGGRVAILFLLFLLAIYQFINAGFSAFAIICMIPLFIIVVYAAFHWQMLTFWGLILVNYFIQWKDFPNTGIPTSLPNEMLDIVLLSIVLIDVRQHPHFERIGN